MTEKKSKSYWGIAIAIIYGSFVVAVVGVVIASRFQQVDLVSKDYYDKEVRYQEQINRQKATQELGYQLQSKYDKGNGSLALRFPDGIDAAGVSGHAVLFRPSNASLDKKFELAVPVDREQLFNCGKLVPGLWKLKVEWQLDTLQLFHEQEIYVE